MNHLALSNISFILLCDNLLLLHAITCCLLVFVTWCVRQQLAALNVFAPSFSVI
jgi:hypothetical protein